jgi:hypothetical protein
MRTTLLAMLLAGAAMTASAAEPSKGLEDAFNAALEASAASRSM